MADKDFVVKNGLVVNTNLIVANGDSNSVGINNSSPDATFVVTGTANVSGNVALGGTLNAGNTSLANTNITGYINASSTANVGGAATLRGSLTVNGATIVANTISTGNNTTTGWMNVSSTANVGGATNLRGTLEVNGAVTIANTLSVGNTSVTGFITATTNSTFSGDITTVNGIRFSTDSSYTVGNTTHRPSKIWSDDIETENITITGFITGTIAPAGSIIPTANLSADLGSSAKWFDELYVRSITTNTFTVSDGGSGVSITSNTQSFKSNSSITAISISGNSSTTNTTFSGNLVTITSNTNVSVANLTVTNGTFISTNGSVTTTVNNSTIQIGDGATVNSTVFSGTSNNSTYLNSQLASYYTNATNLSTGTVPSARLPEATDSVRGGVLLLNSTSSTNTTAAAVPASVKSTYDYAGTIAATAYTNATSYADTKAATAYSNATSYADTKAATAYSNAITFSANASNLGNGTVPSARISGSYTGITGVGTISAGTWQGSEISTTYTQAKVTSVSGGNGLTGTVTSSGSISVLANTGIVANATGTFVNSAYIATISSNNATYFNGQAASYYTNASNLGSGTVPSARLTGSYTIDITGTVTGTANNIRDYTINQNLGSANNPTFAGLSLTGDITTYRSGAPTTGVIYFGNAANRYLFYNGTVYEMPGAQLYINSSLAIHAGNYNNFAPTLGGTGASGTWGISITGNAGTVTNGVYTTGSYGNPSWITSLAGSKITGDISGNAGNITAYTINQSVGTSNSPTFSRVFFGNGSAASPSIAFNSDGAQDTGLYWGGDGYTFFTNNGVKSGEIQPGGDLVMVGNVTAYSDIRLKNNVQTIQNALEKTLKMRGVTYEMNGKSGIGVIAQEIQQIIPEVIVEANDDLKTLTVAYGNIVGVLIEAIKELKAEIEELKANK